MMICPDCKVERADYEGRLGAHLPICPHWGSGKVPSERPWNLVTFGDGSLGWLRPWGSVLRITEADGHNSCWHGDGDFCTRSGHETLSTYWVEPIDDIAIQKSDAEWMRKRGPGGE